jgi:hypothetical protein
MTYIYSILRDNPIGAWSLDALTGSVFTDSSGYDNDASKTGTLYTDRPIVSGGVSSQLISGSATISYPISTVMIEDRESKAFTLEAWIKPQTYTASMAPIIARDNSGLFVDGVSIKFIVDMSTTYTVSYDYFKPGNVYHVIGIYDINSIRLFINSVEVDSTEIVSDTFTDTTTTLTTAASSGYTFVVNDYGVYNYALSNSIISRHYNSGTTFADIVNITAVNGAKYYRYYDDLAYVYYTTTFDTDAEWNAGLFTGYVKSVDDTLINLFSDTTSYWESGTWSYHVPFEADSGISINGSKIVFDYTGDVLVEYSTDGVVFSTVSSGDHMIITQSLTNPYALEIRVTFSSGTESSVSNLKTVFYTSKSVKGSDEDVPGTLINPLAISGGVTARLSETAYNPSSFNDNDGIYLPSGTEAGLKMVADADFLYAAIEMSLFLSSVPSSKTLLYVNTVSSQPQITTNGSSQIIFSNLAALYVDGVSVSSPYSISTGQWHHVVAVFTATASDVYIGNNVAASAGLPMRLSYTSLYADVLSASQVAAIYDAWVGLTPAQIQETNVSNINEYVYASTGQAFTAYDYDWSITGAG